MCTHPTPPPHPLLSHSRRPPSFNVGHHRLRPNHLSRASSSSSSTLYKAPSSPPPPAPLPHLLPRAQHSPPPEPGVPPQDCRLRSTSPSPLRHQGVLLELRVKLSNTPMLSFLVLGSSSTHAMIGSNPALEREWPDLHDSRS
jgi:hypothetical protein